MVKNADSSEYKSPKWKNSDSKVVEGGGFVLNFENRIESVSLSKDVDFGFLFIESPYCTLPGYNNNNNLKEDDLQTRSHSVYTSPYSSAGSMNKKKGIGISYGGMNYLPKMYKISLKLKLVSMQEESSIQVLEIVQKFTKFKNSFELLLENNIKQIDVQDVRVEQIINSNTGGFREEHVEDGLIQPRGDGECLGKFVGLPNLGATCYINSFMQTLRFIPGFRKIIEQKVPNPNVSPFISRLLSTLFRTLDGLSSKNSNEINNLTHSLMHKVVHSLPFVQSSREHQDVHEFSRQLLDLLEEDVGGSNKEASKIHVCFEGKTRTYLDRSCGCPTTHKDDTFQDLVLPGFEQSSIYLSNTTSSLGSDTTRSSSLSFSASKNKTCNVGGSVESGLEKFVETEKIDGFMCEKHGSVSVVKSCKFTELPEYLFMLISRFSQDWESMNGEYVKNNGFFTYPEHLDMESYTTGLDNSSHKYTLHSVIVHSGTADEGHVYCYIKIGDSYYKFDDEECIKACKAEVFDWNFGGRNCISSRTKPFSAYYLCYKKQDLSLSDSGVDCETETAVLNSDELKDYREFKYMEEKEILQYNWAGRFNLESDRWTRNAYRVGEGTRFDNIQSMFKGKSLFLLPCSTDSRNSFCSSKSMENGCFIEDNEKERMKIEGVKHIKHISPFEIPDVQNQVLVVVKDKWFTNSPCKFKGKLVFVKEWSRENPCNRIRDLKLISIGVIRSTNDLAQLIKSASMLSSSFATTHDAHLKSSSAISTSCKEIEEEYGLLIWKENLSKIGGYVDKVEMYDDIQSGDVLIITSTSCLRFCTPCFTSDTMPSGKNTDSKNEDLIRIEHELQEHFKLLHNSRLLTVCFKCQPPVCVLIKANNDWRELTDTGEAGEVNNTEQQEKEIVRSLNEEFSCTEIVGIRQHKDILKNTLDNTVDNTFKDSGVEEASCYGNEQIRNECMVEPRFNDESMIGINVRVASEEEPFDSVTHGHVFCVSHQIKVGEFVERVVNSDHLCFNQKLIHSRSLANSLGDRAYSPTNLMKNVSVFLVYKKRMYIKCCTSLNVMLIDDEDYCEEILKDVVVYVTPYIPDPVVVVGAQKKRKFRHKSFKDSFDNNVCCNDGEGNSFGSSDDYDEMARCESDDESSKFGLMPTVIQRPESVAQFRKKYHIHSVLVRKNFKREDVAEVQEELNDENLQDIDSDEYIEVNQDIL